MSMFHKNPAAARDKAVAELMKIEAVVVEHKTKRAALLLDEGDVTVIASHDIAVAANERAAQILRERIAALTDEVRRQERERQEADRQSAITSIVAPRLSKIEALATAAEQSLAKFFDSYSKLQTAVKDINGADWPASVSRPTHAYYFSISEVERRLATALDRASRNGVKDGASIATGIAESVQHASARWIGALRSAPLPDTASADEEVAA